MASMLARSPAHRHYDGPADAMERRWRACRAREARCRPALPPPDLVLKMLTVLLLFCSNLFMTVAWYGHLKFRDEALWKVVLVSWGIAFFEYCLQVPANRWGYGTFNAAQLKIIQEAITLLVFAGFSILYLGEAIRWNHAVSFLLMVGAVFFVFIDR
jgi:uncharacterized protein (DUF486 family)